jgi:outer membrane immunogenic protein
LRQLTEKDNEMNRLMLATAAAVFAAASPHAHAQEMLKPGSAYNWTGFYAGSLVSRGKMKTNASEDTYIDNRFATPSTTSYAFGSSFSDYGTGLGAYGGANVQFGHLVAGIEADINIMSLKTSGGDRISQYNGFDLKTDTGTLASLRLRAGIAVGNVLVYATGGPALADTDYDLTISNPYGKAIQESGHFSRGYAVGGGVEVGVTENITLRAEALHYDFGKKTGFLEDDTDGILVSNSFSIKQSATVARIGIAYRF